MKFNWSKEKQPLEGKIPIALSRCDNLERIPTDLILPSGCTYGWRDTYHHWAQSRKYPLYTHGQEPQEG